MRITPIDIQQYQFRTRMVGYDKVGVDHFLEMVAEELEHFLRQHQELKEELSRTRSALEEMKQREATLKETLVTTQKVTDELKANARREADILTGEAQLQAERIVRDAEERRVQLINEIQDLKRQKISFETSLRTLVESHVRLLDLDVVALERGGAEDRLLEEKLPFEGRDDSAPVHPVDEEDVFPEES